MSASWSYFQGEASKSRIGLNIFQLNDLQNLRWQTRPSFSAARIRLTVRLLMDAINVELCPRCRASIALTSYTLPFEEDFARGFYNPSSTEKSSIESSLSDSSAELAMLTEEIQRAEVFLRALKIHHAHLERYIHRTTRFIQFSPIRQLPTEILGIIFASACSSCQEDEYKTPLSISLVCSKWRHIAMSTPTLWTNIYVAPYSSARGLPVYQYFLQRCGMIPISVKVEVPAIDHPYQDDDGVIPFKGTYEHHLDVMSDIYASFAQWKHAEFHMKQGRRLTFGRSG
ncbi:hypothetical protein CPB85DRAFT_1256391 [Mucidula mucida]|nr:hypothetical protein CPB85DRAFT_1256391 [Mucidula mucida]